MNLEFFLNCWWPTLFITAWQLIFMAVAIAIVFVIGKICERIFCGGKR